LAHTEYAFKLRPGRIDDTDTVGKIIFEAFSAIADKHGFQREFPTVDTGRGLASSFLSNPRFYSVVAEGTGGEDKDRVVGSNFLDERSNIVVGVGPITVDPKYQNKGIGRQLMTDVLERAKIKNYPAVRLLQASYHNRTLALYASLGFEVREPISTLHSRSISWEFSTSSN